MGRPVKIGKATLQIGKAGITDQILSEIAAQVKQKKVVKIKFLQTGDADQRKEIAKELAERTGLELVELRGKTVILKRKKA